MRIIISPAKKMREDTDSLAWRNLPARVEQTQQLCQVLQGMSYDQLKKLWKCNDQIAQLNVERLKTMDLHRNSVSVYGPWRVHPGGAGVRGRAFAYPLWVLRPGAPL